MIKSKSSLKSVGWDFCNIQFSSSIICLNKMQILHIVTENTCPDYMNALCLLEGIFFSFDQAVPLCASDNGSVITVSCWTTFNMLKVFGWRVLYAKTFLQYMNNCYPFYFCKLSKISALFCTFCVLLRELCFSMPLNR